MTAFEQQKVRQWIAEQLASRWSSEEIAGALSGSGLDVQSARSLVASIAQEASIRVAAEFHYKWKKSQSLLAIILERLGEDTLAEYGQQLQFPELMSAHIQANSPAIFRRLCASWPALDSCHPDQLAKRYAAEIVEVGRARMPDSPFSLDSFDQFHTISFAQFLHEINEEPAESVSYLLARNRLLERHPFSELLLDMPPLTGINDLPSLNSRAPQIWIGPAHTLTPLHHDDCDVLLTQLYGHKQLALVSPRYSGQVDTDHYCFSSFRDEPTILAERLAPLGVNVLILDLYPGDAVLIPIGWWHAVYSKSVSISVTLQDLNSGTQWKQPYLGEAGTSSRRSGIGHSLVYSADRVTVLPEVG